MVENESYVICAMVRVEHGFEDPAGARGLANAREAPQNDRQGEQQWPL